jgi:energy-coupling factor transport system permease protein
MVASSSSIEGGRLPRLHPAGALAYAGALLAALLTVQDPAALVIMGGVLVGAVWMLGAGGQLVELWRGSWMLVAMVVVVNTLTNSNGETVLWTWPWFGGRHDMTLEALVFSLQMALRVLYAGAAMVLAGRLLDVGQTARWFARVLPQTSLLAVLTTLMLPRLRRDWVRLERVSLARGMSIGRGSWPRRLRAQWPVWRAFVEAALEDGWQLSGALQARGWGCGPRTVFHRDRWTVSDTVAALTSAAAGAWMLWGAAHSWDRYTYYPRLGRAGGPEALQLAAGLGGCFLAGLLLLFALRPRPACSASNSKI